MLGLRAGRRKLAYDDAPSHVSRGGPMRGMAPLRLSQPRADRRAFDTSSIKELSIGVAGRLRE
jgi:hypothetical protein